jgi:uncharacterized protein YdaL
MLDSFDMVFYINYEAEYTLPDSFKTDIFTSKHALCWINLQLGELDQKAMKESFGFHFDRHIEDSGFNSVLYKGVIFPKGGSDINIVDIDNPGIAKVRAYAINREGAKVPYIIQSHLLWYVADSPFSYMSERDRYLVFADILHDITGEHHKREHVGLVRLEDINPESDPQSLLKAAQYLHLVHVPFSVAVVPVYIDPDKKEEVHLAQSPELLGVLQELPKLGGSIVLHGYTHQYKGVSTEDYEFWDIAADTPVAGDSVEYASARIDKAIKECFLNGIYPFVWETPHYVASENTFRAIRRYFSVSYGRRNTMEYAGSDQFFPYPVTDIYGEQMIPENLGYIHGEKPDPEDILQAAKLNLAVRDGYASFFFHPFLKLEYLKDVINGLKSMGYTFKDIRDFLPTVEDKDMFVVTQGDRHVRIESPDKYFSIQELDFKGKVLHTNVLPLAKIGFEYNIDCPKSAYVVVSGHNANNSYQMLARN